LIEDATRQLTGLSDLNLSNYDRIILSKSIRKFEGGMTPRKYTALTKAKYLTANRDLVDLVAKKLLVREGAGRSTFYNSTIPGWGWVPKRPVRS